MLPKLSLLDELRKGGYEASLIATFNAYLPFYEEVVLRRFVNGGVRHNVLLMDARQYAASLGSHPPRLAGRRYTLLPIQVAGAFHPKLIFLVGKHKGLVVVGSHNMTLAGFGFNRELTNVVRIQGADDSAGVALARDVWNEVEHWLADLTDGVPKQVAEMVRRVQDFAPWMKAVATPDATRNLLAGRPGGIPLWEQFMALVDGYVSEVSVSGAFFDQELEFLGRVKQDLQPERLTVGIDPTTVQIPFKARSIAGISLVRADRLGVESDAAEDGNRYLHAKGIFVRQTNGGAVFACGSANPSAPAWLATATRGNVELMLAQGGDNARATAEAIGFAAFADMPVLDDSDWHAIEHNQDRQGESELPPHGSGLAVVEDEHVFVDLRLLEGLDSPEFALIAIGGEEIARSVNIKTEGEFAVLEFPLNKLAEAATMHCIIGGALMLELLLHHARAVEEQARTGVQRRFKEALLSLETDTPNIGLLIECIDKIVFSEDQAANSTVLREASSRDNADTGEGKERGSLAIDVSDIKKRKSRHRLIHSGDFAYLLDVLIYHLRIQDDKSIEDLDRYGRSEEEQVGADDGDDDETERLIADQQGELLRLCHSKVRTIISRTVVQMKAFADGKRSLGDVLVRLLAVLAVLRELRGCDGRVAWVETGKTTVPKEQRFRLLEESMLNLFEGTPSLLNLESIGEEFQRSDDVARLKGLLLWLAWDCGLTLDLRKPFMESPKQLRERLRRNAMILALAQMMHTDEVVIDEARQSIGSLTSSEMDWLKEVKRVADHCKSVKQGDVGLQSPQKAAPGDIAVHRKITAWDLRIVASSDGKHVSLIKLSKGNDRINYTPEYLAVTQILPN